MSPTPVFLRTTLPAAVLAAWLASTGVAQAQPPATTAPGASRMAEHHARMAERHQQHLEQLKARLQLTPEQEPAWRAYVARSQPGPAHSRPAAGADRPDLSTLTTPQRIERMKAWQAERQQAQQQRMDATLSFYAALRPEQRQTFDEATAPRFMRAGGHRHAPMTPEKARSS